MSETTFKKQTVTRQAVLVALSNFDAQYPDNNAYENWREKDTYIYAIVHDDKLYPPKHILSVITGISTKEFSGGEQTNRVFEQLGFTVVRKS